MDVSVCQLCRASPLDMKQMKRGMLVYRTLYCLQCMLESIPETNNDIYKTEKFIISKS